MAVSLPPKPGPLLLPRKGFIPAARQLRTARLEGYLLGFTGVEPDPEAVKAARAFAEKNMDS